MPTGKLVFSQLMDHMPMKRFQHCVNRYRGNYKIKSFSCLNQFFCMAFAQLSFRESLRDIEICLRSMQPKLYHMGIRGQVARSTLAKANEHRDWRMYADFAQMLIPRARKLYCHDALGIELQETVYALDSTTIDLCLSLFPWATFRKSKGAIKLHTVLDLRGNIPTCVVMTPGNVHDVNILDTLLPDPGAFYIMDRGYIDFTRLDSLAQASAFFVIRAKTNFKFRRLYSSPIDKATGLKCDQTIVPTGTTTPHNYPNKLRRIRYYDHATQTDFVFLTNNFALPALTITQLYKSRWQVELFFKWIKQHLRIKSFYGTSENAVKTQIWIAIAVYVLIAIVKKRMHLNISLYTFLQILSVSLFEHVDILQLVKNIDYTNMPLDADNQLNLFN